MVSNFEFLEKDFPVLANFGELAEKYCYSDSKASIVGPEAVGAIPYTGQIRFKMTQSLIREYFLYFANSDTYLNQIDRMKTGNCIQHYGPTHLKEVYIPIPPIEEQERIIKQLSSLLP